MAGDYFRQVSLATAKHLDPKAGALAFAAEVERRVAEMVAARRVPARYTRFVDGREGAASASVRPGGTIAFGFSYTADVLLFALSFLRARSPSGPGSGGGRAGRDPRPFRDSFWVAIDGKFIAPGALNPNGIPEGRAELIIGNTQPYNRKVTVQTAGGRPLEYSVPPFIYADCAKALNARFGNSVVAKAVRDIDFPGKYRLRQAQARRGSARPVRRAGDHVESPALVVTPR